MYMLQMTLNSVSCHAQNPRAFLASTSLVNQARGFQSSMGKKAKKDKTTLMDKFPNSPALVSVDYGLWHEVDTRTLSKKDDKKESLPSYREA